MNFPRINAAFETCEKHLAGLDMADPSNIEIEAGLVSYLVLVIVSEYEVFIETAFIQRANAANDAHLSNYVRKQLARSFRSPDLGKINATLGAFGQDYKDGFWLKIQNTKQHACWDNILKARHAIVHKEGTLNLTFRELKASYVETTAVISELLAVIRPVVAQDPAPIVAEIEDRNVLTQEPDDRQAEPVPPKDEPMPE